MAGYNCSLKLKHKIQGRKETYSLNPARKRLASLARIPVIPFKIKTSANHKNETHILTGSTLSYITKSKRIPSGPIHKNRDKARPVHNKSKRVFL